MAGWTSAANVIDANLFDAIEQGAFHFEQSGRVYLAGDWKYRTGIEPHYVVCDKNIRNNDPDFYVPDYHLVRASLDTYVTYAVIKCLTCVKQPVGRLGQLNNYCGFTFHSHGLITYVWKTLSIFDVCPFNMFSDHAALKIGIWAVKPPVKDSIDFNEYRVHTVYKWNTQRNVSVWPYSEIARPKQFCC